MNETAITPVPVAEGEVLDGKYRVERVLGMGGMGVVVAAKHMQLDQRVAIKFVLPQAVGNQEVMERFAREARAAVKLRSEHVARVLDVGTLATGAPYMVMEYLEGSDLGAMLEQGGPLSPVDAVDYVLQACEAIAEAHACGIIHRDLKPRNLFVTTAVHGQPLVKVLDFGISKQTQLGASQGSELSLTRTAAMVGSPNYMSPEQLRSSKAVDARTDIWSLGVILFEVLTSRVPFEAETVTQLTAMVLETVPRPVDELRKDVPAGLARVIARCLERDATKRPASVVDLARELEPFGSVKGVAQRISEVMPRGMTSAPAPSRPSLAASGGTSLGWGATELAKPSHRRAFFVAGGVVSVLALVGAGVFIGVRAGRSSPQAGAPSAQAMPTVRQIDFAPPAPSAPPAIAAPTATPTATATATPSPTPNLTPPPSATATATPSATPTPNLTPPPTQASPIPSSAPSASAPAPARPHAAPAAPKPAKPSDDLPSERN